MNVQIKYDRNHYTVYIDGVFFCTADSYHEASNEVNEELKRRKLC